MPAMTTDRTRDFERYAVTAALALLVFGCYLVVRPFITAFLWGGIIAVSTWSIYKRVLRVLGHRRGWAAALMGLGLAAILLVPMATLGLTLVGQWPVLTEQVSGLMAGGLGQPPTWLSGLPLVGETASGYWQSVATNPERLTQDLKPLIKPVKDFFLAFTTGLGGGLLEFALALLLATLLFVRGEHTGRVFTRIATHLGGDTGRRQVAVVASTVRGVFNGVIGTSAAQAILALIGFWLASVPGTLLLAMGTFFLSVVPGGPVLLWLPAAIWLKVNGATGWAIFMAAWGFFVISGADNILRPLLIGKGVQAPLALIFLGVIGGILAFGFLGLFIGPTLLAIAYNLFLDWLAGREKAKSAE
ncbi:MAG: AI-2E family transporter [Gammaproteobacteria bacterium]|nr:AI-2E family transporter [Gammaproteobacteria bacterium]